jgi:hypothetical protein
LKRFYKLHARRLKLSETETMEYQETKYSMPSSIRDELIKTRANSEGKFRPQYKEIATKWMLKYYTSFNKILKG